MAISPFTVFYNWLCDGRNSEFPEELEKGAVSQMYALSLFCLLPELTQYLNNTLNTYNIWYLTKKDLFIFLKKCILDLKIPRHKLVYFKSKKLDKVYGAVMEKFPFLKVDEIDILLENIDDLETFLTELGVKKENIKKEKIKKSKKKQPILKRYSLENLLENFEYTES
jgi:hypothetical protein